MKKLLGLLLIILIISFASCVTEGRVVVHEQHHPVYGRYYVYPYWDHDRYGYLYYHPGYWKRYRY